MKAFLKVLMAVLMAYSIVACCWWIAGLEFKRCPLMLYAWLTSLFIAYVLYDAFETRKK